MRTFSIAAAAAICLCTSAAIAAPQGPERLHGTIQSYAPATKTLTVKTNDGVKTVKLAADAKVIANKKATVADIKPNDFVASAAMKAPDGKLYAEELRIFPNSLRGVGEGHYKMAKPQETMTNATVEQVRGATAAQANSGTLTVTYHGSEMKAGKCVGHATGPDKGACTGKTQLIVRPGIPVTRWVVGDASWLGAGKSAVMFAMPDKSGALEAHAVIVEHDGIKPHI